MPSSKQVLVVDDEEVILASISRILTLHGFAVVTARNRTEAIERAKLNRPGHAIVDLMLKDGSGLDLLAELQQLLPDTRVVLVTGFGTISTAVEAIRLGAANYLTKPIEVDELLAALDPTRPRAETKEVLQLPTLERAQWEYIQRVLARCGGNISEAARQLGLYRQSLQRILKRTPPRK